MPWKLIQNAMAKTNIARSSLSTSRILSMLMPGKKSRINWRCPILYRGDPDHFGGVLHSNNIGSQSNVGGITTGGPNVYGTTPSCCFAIPFTSPHQANRAIFHWPASVRDREDMRPARPWEGGRGCSWIRLRGPICVATYKLREDPYPHHTSFRANTIAYTSSFLRTMPKIQPMTDSIS